MKHLIINVLVIISSASCKKDIIEEKNHFLRGRLLTECNGNPVADKTIYLQRDYVVGNWLSPDIPSKILDSVKTNDDGYFYFESGVDYLKKQDGSVPGTTSLFTNGDNGYLANGILGDNPNFKDKYGSGKGYVNKDVGDVYLNGMSTNIDLKINTTDINNQVTYDSVGILLEKNSYNYTNFSSISNNYFICSIPEIILKPKNIWYPEEEKHMKYTFILKLIFYKNGNASPKQSKTYYISECNDQNSLIFEF